MDVSQICSNEGLLGIIGILKKVYTLLQIGIPILLLLFGAIDLGKAVMAGDDKEIKAATSLLIKRVIAGAAVVLLFMVVSAVTGLVGGPDWKSCWKSATNSKIETGL